jgi:hypothetical protein
MKCSSAVVREGERGKRLIVISCGGRKIWDSEPDHGPCPARDAYIGRFFKVNRRYAERFAPESWAILSSRFGLVRPETPITNYNARFDRPETHPITVEKLRDSVRQFGVGEFQEVEVLAGRAYVEPLRRAIEGIPIKLIAPYAGCRGIGGMMHLATSALEGGAPMDSWGDT